MKTWRRVCLGLVVAASLSACAAPGLYHWGRYEDAIFDLYIEPGSVSTSDEIALLEADIEQAMASGKVVPPGLHAHLAYLYVLEGNHPTALVHFQTEKAKFPESERFIDGMIERMQQ